MSCRWSLSLPCPSPWKCAPGLLVTASPGATHSTQHGQAGAGGLTEVPTGCGVAPVLQFHSGYSWASVPSTVHIDCDKLPCDCPMTRSVSSAPTCQDCDLFPGACSWFSSLLRTPSSSPLQGDAQGLGLLPSCPLSALWPSAASRLAAAACSSRALCVSSGA